MDKFNKEIYQTPKKKWDHQKYFSKSNQESKERIQKITKEIYANKLGN